jgi:hypothetical protein
MQQRKQNDFLGIMIHTDLPITKHNNRLTESQRLKPTIHIKQRRKTTRHAVQYPPPQHTGNINTG